MMSIKKRNAAEAQRRAYAREMLRSALVSLFWNAFVWKRGRNPGYTKQMLAKELGVNKSAPSRWFSSSPNWTLNTIADLAWALNLELEIRARERTTRVLFAPHGLQETKLGYRDISSGAGEIVGKPPKTTSSTDQSMVG